MFIYYYLVDLIYYSKMFIVLVFYYSLSYPEKLENKEDLSSFCKGEVRFLS